MTRFSQIATAVALAGVTASASAWWGGPFSGFGNDFWGDGGFSFSFSARGSGHGWGRYYDYYGPYGPYAYGPYSHPYLGGYAPATYGYPLAMSEERRAAVAQQQTTMLQQAVEAQRQFAEQIAQQQTALASQWQTAGYDPLSVDPFAGFDPFSSEPLAASGTFMPSYVKELIEQSDAEFEKAKARNQARRDAFQKRVQERREAMQQRIPDFAPWAEQAADKSI